MNISSRIFHEREIEGKQYVPGLLEMVFISEGQNAARSVIISIPKSESKRVRVVEG